jgi:hypothetical protein
MRLVSILAALTLASCDRAPATAILSEPNPPSSVAPPSIAPPAPDPAPASAMRTPDPAEEKVDDLPEALRWPTGYVAPEIWEMRNVVLDGATETWKLRWKQPPRSNGCAGWGCPCDGVKWGLAGALELVRERPGKPNEHLDLGAPRGGVAQIPGFVESPLDNDLLDAEHNVVRPGATLAQAVKRPHPQVMRLHDYDHDGWAAEFVYQVGYLACGQNPSVLVGVSKARPYLHVFGTAENPEQALVMTYVPAWDTIRLARGKTVEIPLHVCGDHGGGGRYMTLRFDAAAGLHVVDEADWGCGVGAAFRSRTVRLSPERYEPNAAPAGGVTL